MDITITDDILFQLLNTILYIGIIAIVYNYLKNIHNIEEDRDIIKNKTRKNKFSQRKKNNLLYGISNCVHFNGKR